MVVSPLRTRAAAAPAIANVRDFGAIGNGLADDTAAFQAAIDSAITRGDPVSTTRTAMRSVYVPSGTYRITRALRVWSVEHFRLRGDGDSSRLLADAATMEAVLDLNGTAFSSFADLSISGTKGTGVTRAVWVRWTRVGRSSTVNTFSRITVIDLRYQRAAFEIGDAASAAGQVDTTAWYFCTAAGRRTSGGGDSENWQSGFLVGTGTFGNNLLHHFYGCNSTHNRWGMNLSASQMLWSGGIVQSNDVDFMIGTTSYCAIKGVRSEESLRFLETGGPATFPATVSVEDVNWHPEKLNADGYILRWKFGGSLRLASMQVANAPGKSPKLLIETTAAVTLHLDGYSTTVPLTSLIEARLGAKLRTIVSGYTQTDVGGSATAPTVATDGLDLFTSGTLRTPAGRIFGVAPGVIGTDRVFVASASSTSGISIRDDVTGRIEPSGGAPRALTIAGWTALDVNGKATISGSTGYPAFNGHRMEWGATAPSSGAWRPGDVVWSTAPREGAPAGWICVAAGEPGEWKAMSIVR
jgi:hypothetical protein